ncbi:MAG: glycosyltransferase, partial [Bacteroidetes bacterium]
YQPDLIVSRFWLPFMGPSVGTIQRLAGKRAVRVGLIDNALPHESRPGDRPLTRWYLGSLDAALVMSQAVADDLARLGFRKPVARAPHPVYDNFGAPATREEAIQSLGLSANATWLLFFGFIRPYKGLDLAIEALASPLLRQREDLRLLVAGESYTDTAPWRDLAERLGVADRIVWHEQYIPTERVRYYFGAADLVVQPYKSATQSGITQIAYHFGKPMVVTRVGGLPEMVPHERAGLVVPPTAEAIAEAIARYLDDEHLRQQLEKGVREVARQYTWAHLAETLLALASASRDKS